MMNREIYLSHQRERFGLAEGQEREEIAYEQETARKHLHQVVAQAKIQAVLDTNMSREVKVREAMLEDAEARRQMLDVQATASQMRFLEGADAAAGWNGSEPYQRKELEDEEEFNRVAMRRSAMLTEINHALSVIDQQEMRWREQIEFDEEKTLAAILGFNAGFRLVSIQGRQDPHSEPNYRLFQMTLEAKHRRRLAVHFCCLYCEWEQDWQRMTIRLLQRCTAQHLVGYGKILLQELQEFCDIAMFWEPVRIDIMEEIAVHEQRRERRNRKIEWLKRLKEAEVERSKRRESTREDYVRFWQQDELSKVLNMQETIVENIQQHGAPGAWEAHQRRFERDLEGLANQPFAVVKRYREHLLGFDSWVSAVERNDVSLLAGPEAPLAITDGSPSRGARATQLAAKTEIDLDDPNNAVAQFEKELMRGKLETLQNSSPARRNIAGHPASGAMLGAPQANAHSDKPAYYQTAPSLYADEGGTGRELLDLYEHKSRLVGGGPIRPTVGFGDVLEMPLEPAGFNPESRGTSVATGGRFDDQSSIAEEEARVRASRNVFGSRLPGQSPTLSRSGSPSGRFSPSASVASSRMDTGIPTRMAPAAYHEYSQSVERGGSRTGSVSVPRSRGLQELANSRSGSTSTSVMAPPASAGLASLHTPPPSEPRGSIHRDPTASSGTPMPRPTPEQMVDAHLREAERQEAVMRSRMKVNQVISEHEERDELTNELDKLQSWLRGHVAHAAATAPAMR